MIRRLWAPWRSRFIHGPKSKACVFCEKPRAKRDKTHFIVKRGKRVYTMLNLYPYNGGHMLISPYRHTGDLDGLTAEELSELFTETQAVIRLLKKRLGAAGFNVGLNLGDAGGASIASHLHVHVVPRWKGDTNFMPVIHGTKVIAESLETVYRLLTAGPARSSGRKKAWKTKS